MAQSMLLIIVCEFNLTPCGKPVYLNVRYNLKLAFHLPEGQKDDKWSERRIMWEEIR